MRTPLYDLHQKYNGKIIDFGGWDLPVQYKGIIEEHENVRNACGLFDVSHMGEVFVEGEGAENFIQKLITNDVSNIVDGQIIYSPMCYQHGGIVDDVIVMKYSNCKYLIIVNAANIEKDFEWIKQNAPETLKLTNASSEYAQMAIQGPNAEKILQKVVDAKLSELKFFRFLPEADLNGIKVIVARSGYTGEDGFEVYVKSEYAHDVWETLMEAGKEDGIVPVGLGARDTLRFEVALPLYGHELSKDINPLEAKLARFVKLDKEDFIGKDALVAQKESGIKRRLVGFEMVDRGIARNGYEIHSNGTNIGFVTSGSFSPSTQKNLGLALVDIDHVNEDTEFDVVIRGKNVKAKVIKTPFYKKSYKN